MNKYLANCILEGQTYPLTCKAASEDEAAVYLQSNYAVERVADIKLIEEDCVTED